MIEALSLLRERRVEVANFREETLVQKNEFVKQQALKYTAINTKAVVMILAANRFYKEGFNLFNEAKDLICSSKEQFDEKAELLDHSQLLIGIGNEFISTYIKSELPYYFKARSKDPLYVRGLIQLINDGRFSRVDSLIKEFTQYINVDRDFIRRSYIDLKDLDLSNKEELEFLLECLEEDSFEEVITELINTVKEDKKGYLLKNHNIEIQNPNFNNSKDSLDSILETIEVEAIPKDFAYNEVEEIEFL